ncbi:MAG: carbamoyltransferase C-terminal domain-containing protein [Candidatus Peregrinibacteria bacterium]|nr:carbamoyltransferase C-terminal domain-containing protein [Candidatus Peregrinibacteria bacterium]
MKVLGISEPDRDAGAALIKNGRIVYSANEERFSRKKLHQGFPYKTIDWLLEESGWALEDLDAIVIAKPPLWLELKQNFAPYLKVKWFKGGRLFKGLLEMAFQLGYFIPQNVKTNIKLDRQIKGWLSENNVPSSKVARVNHHLSHAASTYFTSGFDEACVVTCDGQGAGETATIWHGKNGKLKKIHQVYVPHSMGYFYGLVTHLLGYTANRHEGKITGLAGFGPFDHDVYELCKEVAEYKEGTFTVHNLFGNYFTFKKLIKKSKEGPTGVSAAFQKRLEDVLVSYVTHYVKKLGLKNVAMAGGVFANVKLNQRIHEIKEVDSVFIFSQMNDGGIGAGAAIQYCAENMHVKPEPIKNVYLGPQYSNEEIEETLQEKKLKYRRPKDYEAEVAKLLTKGKVVGLCQGRMEAGPRALGNRTIMYEAKDPAVNDWLNERLNRSEFMPFAPVTLWEDRHKYYKHLEGVEHTAQFMTITVNCTEKFKKECPAAFHKDGTARPQLIKREQNPRYYGILEEYKKLSGCSTLINTSFNMHEEPIVRTPQDAIRAFLLGNLDVLAIGDFLVEQEVSSSV